MQVHYTYLLRSSPALQEQYEKYGTNIIIVPENTTNERIFRMIQANTLLHSIIINFWDFIERQINDSNTHCRVSISNIYIYDNADNSNRKALFDFPINYDQKWDDL